MIHELHEITTENDGIRAWAFFVVLKGTDPLPNHKPFTSGSWTPGVDDAEGQVLYEEGRREAMFEVERLTRNGRIFPRR